MKRGHLSTEQRIMLRLELYLQYKEFVLLTSLRATETATVLFVVVPQKVQGRMDRIRLG